jgi:hypothetical protein
MKKTFRSFARVCHKMLLNRQKRFSAKLNAQHKVINPPELRSNTLPQFLKKNVKP